MSKAEISRRDDAIPMAITRNISFRFDGGIVALQPLVPGPDAGRSASAPGPPDPPVGMAWGSMERALQVKHNLCGIQGSFASAASKDCNVACINLWFRN